MKCTKKSKCKNGLFHRMFTIVVPVRHEDIAAKGKQA